MEPEPAERDGGDSRFHQDGQVTSEQSDEWFMSAGHSSVGSGLDAMSSDPWYTAPAPVSRGNKNEPAILQMTCPQGVEHP